MKSHKGFSAMKSTLLVAASIAAMASASARAQEEDHASHNAVPPAPRNADIVQGVEHGGDQHAQPSAPDPAHASRGDEDSELRDPHGYSGGYTLESGPYVLPGPRRLRLADEDSYGSVLVERLERIDTDDGNATAYDLQAWFGRDFNRLVIKAEGDYGQGRLQDSRTEALWSRAVTSYWDTQLGVRFDNGVGPDREWLAFGIQGLAPYWFDVEATGYIGESGRTALRLSALYDLLLTQRLILQPRAELNIYGKDDEEREIGSGLSDAEFGVRLRYEFSRQFAPYIGVEWAGKFGETADLARDAGEDKNETRWVFGFRAWF
jgi:copper resistance protein B